MSLTDILKSHIQIITGTTENLNNSTYIFLDGQFGYDKEAKILKIGNGIDIFKDLKPLNTSNNSDYLGLLSRIITNEDNIEIILDKIEDLENSGQIIDPNLLSQITTNKNDISNILNNISNLPTTEGYNNIQNSIDSMNSEIGTINTKISNIETDINSIDSTNFVNNTLYTNKVNEIDSEISSIETSLTNHSSSIENISNNSITKTEYDSNNTSINNRIVELETIVDQIQPLTQEEYNNIISISEKIENFDNNIVGIVDFEISPGSENIIISVGSNQINIGTFNYYYDIGDVIIINDIEYIITNIIIDTVTSDYIVELDNFIL